MALPWQHCRTSGKYLLETGAIIKRSLIAFCSTHRSLSELNLEQSLKAVFKKIVARKIQFAAHNSLSRYLTTFRHYYQRACRNRLSHSSRADNRLTDENADDSVILQHSLVGGAGTSIGGVTGLGGWHFIIYFMCCDIYSSGSIHKQDWSISLMWTALMP
jgi:hypothetical protein